MRQRFGQNFLINKHVAEAIVAAAALAPGDTVLEIGPGKGVLTGLIAPRVRALDAVELDRSLAAALAERFKAQSQVRIICQDFLAFALDSLPCPVKVIANLPYYMSTAIIEKLLPHPCWSIAVFMVQKEVGDRIKAAVSTREYGYYSLMCQYFAHIEPVMRVNPGSFFPRPKVDSVVLRFVNKGSPPPPQGLFVFIQHAFQQRRKTVLNSLSGSLKLPKEKAHAALCASGIEPALRPENLSFDDFQRLFSTLQPLLATRS
ncbi:MAG: 16S rRNA (adenine(1518)-N(6)/adenine(1519)-N(6))-dimethyltransferase RsmA [Endomicrobiales bacterium]